VNKWLWLAVIAVAVLGIFFWSRPRADVLQPGVAAPDFDLPDARGEIRRLTDYRGSWLLLYFYPKDDTPGCTKEACAFRDGYTELRQRGVQVVGVSTDDSASHQQFATKHNLPFPLLSDVDGEIAGRYGALWSFGPIRIAKRHSFLIDASGNINQIYRNVDPDNHYRQVLEDLAKVKDTQR
jgi:peroxiredoxin Q/BCP